MSKYSITFLACRILELEWKNAKTTNIHWQTNIGKYYSKTRFRKDNTLLVQVSWLRKGRNPLNSGCIDICLFVNT